MTRSDLIAALQDKNVQAFLRAIRLGEGTSGPLGYQTIVGGQLFTSYLHHPRIRVWIHKYQVWSTAAGAYQLIFPTWSALVKQYEFEDFSPANQDQAAIALIAEKHALETVINGDALAAAHLCRDVWASLPDAQAGQRTVTADAFLAEYQKWIV